MSFAYLTLYTGDYLRDTRHLSCCEHGIYLMLLMHCWDSRAPVPLDERKIAGICGARSGDEIEAMRRVLNEFFTRMDDGHYNRRMQREIERASAISNARQSAAFTRHKGRDASQHANAMQLHSKSNALDTNTTTNTNISTTTSTTTSTEKVKNTRRASRLSIDKLPLEWSEWTRQNRPDLNPQSVFDQFRDYWISVAGAKGNKLDWEATWRNWCRNQGNLSGGRKTLSEKNNDAVQQWLQGEKDVTNG